ncbi:MAG: peptidoglycan DD-metalloendopeptidase family protein [Patescibacteria group bacterium]
MKKFALWGFGLAVVATIPLVSIKIGASDNVKAVSKQGEALQLLPQSDLPEGIVKEYKIEPGDTFAEVMTGMNVPYEQAYSILSSSKDVFDFTKMNAGKVLKLVFVQEAFAAMEYPLNSDTVVHVKKQEDAFVATEEEIPYVIENATARGTITDSLFLAAQSVGLEDKATMGIADVFSSDIDFATDIREGDSFSVVYEKRTLDGKDAGAGRILAAKFTNGDKTYTAFRFNDKFYDSEGKSLARQFLKSPLNYARISSGFSYKRTNPVTKQVTPHRAIDYAADSGTPVIATADGKVTVAGSKGGLGITVEVKHGNYLTQYAHLSKIAKDIETGATVEQGDVIGYVGSTGISTGPHLQYAMFENGSPINPLTTDFPRGEAVSQTEMSSFQVIRDKFESDL